MTTIIYDHKNKEVAVDSRVSSGMYIVSDDHNKTVRNEYGLWILSGSLADSAEMITLGHNHSVRDPSNLPDAGAFLLSGGKCYAVYIEESGYCKHIPLEYSDSMGSGATAAMGALDHGSTAKQAVKYASTRDAATGGKIRVFKLSKY